MPKRQRPGSRVVGITVKVTLSDDQQDAAAEAKAEALPDDQGPALRIVPKSETA
jgi:hypothetical protein